MYEIGGIYSKGGAKIKKVQFEDDTKVRARCIGMLAVSVCSKGAICREAFVHDPLRDPTHYPCCTAY